MDPLFCLSGFNVPTNPDAHIHTMSLEALPMQAMADLAEFVAAQSRAGDLASLAASAAPLSGLLQHVQWQAAVLLEATSWSLCGTQSQPARHSNKTMSTKVPQLGQVLDGSCNHSTLNPMNNNDVKATPNHPVPSVMLQDGQ